MKCVRKSTIITIILVFVALYPILNCSRTDRPKLLCEVKQTGNNEWRFVNYENQPEVDSVEKPGHNAYEPRFVYCKHQEILCIAGFQTNSDIFNYIRLEINDATHSGILDYIQTGFKDYLNTKFISVERHVEPSIDNCIGGEMLFKKGQLIWFNNKSSAFHKNKDSYQWKDFVTSFTNEITNIKVERVSKGYEETIKIHSLTNFHRDYSANKVRESPKVKFLKYVGSPTNTFSPTHSQFSSPMKSLSPKVISPISQLFHTKGRTPSTANSPVNPMLKLKPIPLNHLKKHDTDDSRRKSEHISDGSRSKSRLNLLSKSRIKLSSTLSPAKVGRVTNTNVSDSPIIPRQGPKTFNNRKVLNLLTKVKVTEK